MHGVTMSLKTIRTSTCEPRGFSNTETRGDACSSFHPNLKRRCALTEVVSISAGLHISQIPLLFTALVIEEIGEPIEDQLIDC